MKAFLDTSSLFKRYLQEKGSDELERVLSKVSELYVAPISIIEMYSIIDRKIQDKSITFKQSQFLKDEIQIDFQYYSQVIWGQNLIDAALEVVYKYHLRTLDSIQLASAVLSESELFITSDQNLYQAASKRLNKAMLI